jgi:hypothetical protein
MDKNFTLTLLTILPFSFSLQSQAQAPKIKFRQPHLVFGIDKQENAVYKFSNVIAGVDANLWLQDLNSQAPGFYIVTKPAGNRTKVYQIYS